MCELLSRQFRTNREKYRESTSAKREILREPQHLEAFSLIPDEFETGKMMAIARTHSPRSRERYNQAVCSVLAGTEQRESGSMDTAFKVLQIERAPPLQLVLVNWGVGRDTTANAAMQYSWNQSGSNPLPIPWSESYAIPSYTTYVWPNFSRMVTNFAFLQTAMAQTPHQPFEISAIVAQFV